MVEKKLFFGYGYWCGEKICGFKLFLFQKTSTKIKLFRRIFLFKRIQRDEGGRKAEGN